MTHARTSIIDEICLATGLARGDATARAETGVLARREPDRTTSALAALTTGPVSYTHLDVYKRQPRSRQSRATSASDCTAGLASLSRRWGRADGRRPGLKPRARRRG